MHGNNKSEAELRLALQHGVGRIIVDSSDEITRLENLCAELDTTARVMIRVTTGVEAHTHEYIATAHEDQKFGFSIASGQALDALRAVRWPILQSSANHSGRPDARTLDEVPEDIRAGADLVIDGGELPGTPSTVIDLTADPYRIVREGALTAAEVASILEA